MQTPSNNFPPSPHDVHPNLLGAPSFYVTGEDNLQIVSYNSATGVTLTIVGRLLGVDGVTRPFVETHTPNTDRTAKTTYHPIGEGWLQNVVVYASAGSPQIGQAFVNVRVVRGLSGARQELATLLQGFCTGVQRLAWPGSPIVSTTASPGAVKVITGTDPAAGAECSDTVPTGARWRLISYAVTVVFANAGIERTVAIVVDDGATAYWRGISLALLNPNSTVVIAAGAGLGAAGLDSYATAQQTGLPNGLLLLAGHRIKTATTTLNAADNYAAPRILVEEFIEGA